LGITGVNLLQRVEGDLDLWRRRLEQLIRKSLTLSLIVGKKDRLGPFVGVIQLLSDIGGLVDGTELIAI
jgi:hypothetical protein